jgi:hypothetical protein
MYHRNTWKSLLILAALLLKRKGFSVGQSSKRTAMCAQPTADLSQWIDPNASAKS